MNKKTNKILKNVALTSLFVGAFLIGVNTPIFATDDPIQVVNNLSNFIFGLIRANDNSRLWNSTSWYELKIS